MCIDMSLFLHLLCRWSNYCLDINVADDDVPAIKAVSAPVGDDGAIVDGAIFGEPAQRVAQAATVNTGDFEIGHGHG